MLVSTACFKYCEPTTSRHFFWPEGTCDGCYLICWFAKFCLPVVSFGDLAAFPKLLAITSPGKPIVAYEPP